MCVRTKSFLTEQLKSKDEFLNHKLSMKSIRSPRDVKHCHSFPFCVQKDQKRMISQQIRFSSSQSLRKAKVYQRHVRRAAEGELIDIRALQENRPASTASQKDTQMKTSYRKRLKNVIPRPEIKEKIKLYRLGLDQSLPSLKNAPIVSAHQVHVVILINVFILQLPTLRLQYQIKDTKILLPPRKLPEFAFIGRSNVGKSYLINALTSPTHEATSLHELKRSFRATAGISSTPGYTSSLDFYKCGDICTLVDMPGYGFAQTSSDVQRTWSDNIQRYLIARKSDTLKKLFVLFDAKWGPLTTDREFFKFIASKRVPVQFILTKCDQVPADELARRHQMIEEELAKLFPPSQWENKDLMMVSSKTFAGIEAVRRLILRCSEKADLIPKESLSRESMENSWIQTQEKTPSEEETRERQSPFRTRPHQKTQQRGKGADKRLQIKRKLSKTYAAAIKKKQ